MSFHATDWSPYPHCCSALGNICLLYLAPLIVAELAGRLAGGADTGAAKVLPYVPGFANLILLAEEFVDTLAFSVVASIVPLALASVVLWRYDPLLVVVLVSLIVVTGLVIAPLVRRRQALVDRERLPAHECPATLPRADHAASNLCMDLGAARALAPGVPGTTRARRRSHMASPLKFLRRAITRPPAGI